MCFAKQPEPDINKPNYTPDKIDQNMVLTVKEPGKKPTTIDQTPEEAAAKGNTSKINTTQPVSSMSGIRMRV